MSEQIKPTKSDFDIAKFGLKIQYESMFDAETRVKLEELGIQKLLDHIVTYNAIGAAHLRFCYNCLHPEFNQK